MASVMTERKEPGRRQTEHWRQCQFQLERVKTFRPKVAVLLNVTDDHLDRYPSFDAYARAVPRLLPGRQSRCT